MKKKDCIYNFELKKLCRIYIYGYQVYLNVIDNSIIKNILIFKVEPTFDG